MRQSKTQLTIRLSSDLFARIREKSRRSGLKRADIVRIALKEFLEGAEETSSVYERVKHLAGSIKTGIPDLGQRHRDYLIRKFRKHS